MSDSGDVRQSEFEGRPDLIKARARSHFAWQLLVVVVALYMIGTMSITALNAITGWETRSALLSCVEPTGDCYKEGQKNQSAAIQQLIEANSLDEVATRKIVVAAAACADRVENDSVEKIQRCVDREVKEGNDE